MAAMLALSDLGRAGSFEAMPRHPPTFQPDEVRALAASLEASEPVPPAALAAACRAVCATLAQRHPGRSVELRVPPYAAVQVGLDEAGAHRRGTPPNVVEVSPAVLVRLAAGTLTWADARAAHQVSASGTRSDLAAVFPLIGAPFLPPSRRGKDGPTSPERSH